MTIPFTQYLLPDGRQREVEIDRGAEIEQIAHAFIASGGRYECEILTTGQVSITAVKTIRGEEQDVAIEVGWGLPGQVGHLVDRVVAQSADFIEVAA